MDEVGTPSNVRYFENGKVMHIDCRNEDTKPRRHRNSEKISLLQWNIERGYKLPGILDELKEIDADIMCIQEIDVRCARSGNIDTGLAIAAELNLNYVFFEEFEELESPLRTEKTQGGGTHGNGIFTKWNISDIQLVKHSEHPIDWNNPTHMLAKKEPRKGERAVLRVTVETPNAPLVVYCAHFEVFCGMLFRIRHLAEIFEDSRKMIDRGFFNQVIMGDLNTMAHGIARFSPAFCQDQMRFRSLGSDEAVMWERYVLSVEDPQYHPESDRDMLKRIGRSFSHGDELPRSSSLSSQSMANGKGLTRTWKSTSNLRVLSDNASAWRTCKSPDMVSESELTKQESKANAHLLRWGCDPDVSRSALNPGFSCPFPASSTITLDHPTYRLFGISLMRGKLDWILMRRLQADSKELGNMDFSLSDHRWMRADVRLM